MTELKERLRELPFWKHLSTDEKERVEALAVIRDYEVGNILHATEGDCLGLVTVISGSVRAYMMSEEGREITLYHIREEECDVLTASCIMYQITFDTQMIIEEESRILIIPTSVLARLKEENIFVRSFIYETLTERFSDVMWTIQQILFYGIDQRIAAYLINTAEEMGCIPERKGAGAGMTPADRPGGSCPEIKVTHEQIAQEINTAREVVARIVRRFIDDGLIATGRGKIRITDYEGLYALAEDLLI